MLERDEGAASSPLDTSEAEALPSASGGKAHLLTVRAKLFLISTVVIIVGGLTSGLLLESELRHALVSRVDNELLAHAGSAVVGAEQLDALSRGEASHALIRRLGEATQARVTLLDAEGRVIADSELSPAQLQGLESHADRPEFRAALEKGVGRSRRHSATLGTDMLYVARTFGAPSRPVRGVIRVATPLASVDAASWKLRGLVLLGCLAGVAVAVFMSFLASRLVSRRLLDLVVAAQRVAEGGRLEPVAIGSKDEIGDIAEAFNRMIAALDREVATLDKERNRFQVVLEGMEEAVVAVNKKQEIALVNPAAVNLLGLMNAPVLGRPFSEVVSLSGLHDALETLRDEKRVTAELTLPGDPPRQVEVHGTSLGKAGRGLIVLRDVTELRRLETVRRDFIGNVSHELRTPVSIIRANAETLQSGALEDTERARIFIDALLRNAERLSNLVDDLLDISRLESGTQKLGTRPGSLAPVLGEAIEDARLRAEAKQLDLALETDAEHWATFDAMALGQVVTNLLDNAVKYTPSGGRVVLRSRVHGESLRIEVEDNGLGIEPGQQARIFERFYRVDPGRSREMGGTGLGLAIVKHLVAVMGGQVGVESIAPRGSLFWVTLPRAEAATAAAS